jgi:hypoxanthine phosphoribosyltransferase
MYGESMKVKVVFDKDVIAKRVKELGREISARYDDEPLVCVCVLKGAFVFFADLMRSLTIDPELDFVRLASYAGGTSREGKMVFSKDMEVSIEDKHVLIVEDIVDTGHSMRYLTRVLEARNPRSIAIAALVDKSERREVDVTVDFPGFALDKGFIVGYGLDYDEKYRGMDGVYELVFED